MKTAMNSITQLVGRIAILWLTLWLTTSSLAIAGFTTPPGIDGTAPTLTTAPQTVSVAQTSVTLRWVTNEIADSQVSFGPTGSGTTRVTGELEQVAEHLITLTNLTAATAYSYSVRSTDPSGNTFTSQTLTFTTASAPDTTAPSFGAGPSIVSIADTSAVVSWSSNEPTTATVSFGAGNTNQQTASPTLTLNHSVTLTGLLPGTNYTVRVDMADLAGNTVAGSVQNFTTTGIAPAPGFGISANSLSFGSQAQGTSSNSQSVTLTNTGTATMTISSIIATGDFGQSNTCGTSLNFNTSCTISVTFTPTTTGTRTGNLTITSNASGSPHSVSLSGTGTIALVSLSPSLVTGFNMLGNSLATPIDVVATFGNATTTTPVRNQTLTVWKWVLQNGIGKWAFHATSLTAAENATYAANSGFAVLTTINPKEGYWVNAASPYTLTLPAAVATTFTNNDFANNPNWPRGFNLIAIGSAMTPTQFNNTVAQSTPPTAGQMSANFVSLWTWNAKQTRWYFYAPSLERDGGLAAVKAYADAQSFLDFSTNSRLLELGMGFWVNKP